MNAATRLPHAFGRYILRARVAAGGMAEVFRATLPGFGGFEKEVAIKRMYRQYSDDTTFVEMLTDEAKIVSQLHHPNIVQILDVGRVDEDYYIAFEYVDGVDLFRLLQKQYELGRDLPLAIALHIVAELCSALDYAHARCTHSGEPLSIVHRDVSPQNVLIGHQGEVKLTDFGIAKAAYRFTQTQAGMIKGKLYYMSPEQARGEPIDHRSDLFAAGILLYELLCTRPLYGDGKPKELLAKVGRGEYAWPAEKKARVPMALLAVVDKALQRNAGQRYQTGREFRAALLRVADQLGLRTDREALGAYVRKVYAVIENRPPPVGAASGTQSRNESREAGRWSTNVDEVPVAPGDVDQPTTRRPERAGSLAKPGLPRAQRRATPAPAAKAVKAVKAARPPADAAPIPAAAVEDGVPPPLPTATARSPDDPPSDDATAMLDMSDLAARLAKAPPPKPLVAGPARKPPRQGAAVPAAVAAKAKNPHLLRTGGQHRPSSMRPPPPPPPPPPPGTNDAPKRDASHRRKAYPRPATRPQSAAADAATRAVQAMADSAVPPPPPSEASTRFVPAMTDAPPTPAPRPAASRPRTPQPKSAPARSASSQQLAAAAARFAQSMAPAPLRTAPLDPALAPASWPLIGLTTAVWAGVVVLGVYSVLLLVH